MITWDEPKRRENLRKHGIDLAELEPVFDLPMITVEDSACATASSGCKAWACGAAKSSFLFGRRAVTTSRTSSPAVMPTARKSKRTSLPFSAAEIAAAKAAAKAPSSKAPTVDWSQGTVTRGGGVAATIGAIRRTRGPNKNPIKEQVAIRFDREVLVAFRAGGPGWQTRMNAALKEWLASHPAKRRSGRAQTGG